MVFICVVFQDFKVAAAITISKGNEEIIMFYYGNSRENVSDLYRICFFFFFFSLSLYLLFL